MLSKFEQMHASNPLIAVVLVIEANAVLAHSWGVRVVVIRGLIEVTSRYHCHLLYQCPIGPRMPGTWLISSSRLLFILLPIAGRPRATQGPHKGLAWEVFGHHCR